MADEEKTTIYFIQDQPPSLICYVTINELSLQAKVVFNAGITALHQPSAGVWPLCEKSVVGKLLRYVFRLDCRMTHGNEQ